MSLSSLSTYLATMNASNTSIQANETALSPAESNSASSSSVSSPSKRARSDSPDTSVSSTSPPEGYFSKQDSLASTTISTSFTRPPHHAAPVSSCSIIRSILCSTISSENTLDFASHLSSPVTSSPPLSRPLSRRSSTGCSQKSVRFARCTNASVFPALSGEEYDRSPIIPTTESESLELPKRKRGEAEGWIKCVERERAAAAKKGLGFKLGVDCKPCGPRPTVTVSSLENPVEGVHGLIEGGYFVGEERDGDRFSEEGDMGDEDEDHMLVDDEQTGPAGHDPLLSMSILEPGSLIQDDSSGDDDEDFERASDVEDEDVEDEEDEEDARDTTVKRLSAGPSSPVPEDDQSATSLERVPSDQSSSDTTITSATTAESAGAETASAREDREAKAAAKVKANKSRERYGLCALGKYTRQEVFQSYDSLGGF